jgi:hypothetical protein
MHLSFTCFGNYKTKLTSEILDQKAQTPQCNRYYSFICFGEFTTQKTPIRNVWAVFPSHKDAYNFGMDGGGLVEEKL